MIDRKKYSVCLIRPSGYIHSSAFAELAGLVAWGIRDAGHPASIVENTIDPAATNIVIGCHLMPLNIASRFPPSTVMINTEQLGSASAEWSDRIVKWARRYEIWDYSQKNVDTLRTRHAVHNVKLLRLGYHPKLDIIEPTAGADIDVLFYGFVNERRAAILDGLKRAGLRVASVTGVYGAQRDALIARAKLVLNMHYYESHIFEIVRVFYLMTNGSAVVSEVGATTSIDVAYIPGIYCVPYEELIDKCIGLSRDDDAIMQLRRSARETIKQFPQKEIMMSLLNRTV
ncbi:hypothetical protein [Burkholderia ubonensis]|uniref:hypothetical protein n=1 Tax=Burkholderia ubonensis TaxID=101571 RepID=UPI00075C14A4|nr:hypothetical protein [Burkholderia ubonensis]KWB79379.1 hypothetical protein WL42_12500 [Burkholderia ubonensis]